MHRESKKETRLHSKKPAKPDVTYEEEMMKRQPKSALDIDRVSKTLNLKLSE